MVRLDSPSVFTENSVAFGELEGPVSLSRIGEKSADALQLQLGLPPCEPMVN